MKPRKPLNVGDMVKVWSFKMDCTIWRNVISVNSDGSFMTYGGCSFHRNQVYKVKRKVKKKETVFPEHIGFASSVMKKTSEFSCYTTRKEYRACYDLAVFSIPVSELEKLTKKQRKLYQIPEGVK